MKELFNYRKGDTFEVTEEHLNLLAEAEWEYDDSMYYGAPEMNLKRPYGNGDVVRDICETIGEKPFESYEGEKYWSKEQFEKAMKLHHELPVVLAIICQTRLVKPGTYKTCEDFGRKWEPA